MVVVVVVVDEEKSWHLLGWVALVGFDVSEDKIWSTPRDQTNKTVSTHS